MSKAIQDYMTVNECIEYLNENKLFKVNKHSFRDKFKKIAVQQLLKDNVILKDDIVYINRNFIHKQIELYQNSIYRPTAIRKIVELLNAQEISYDNIDNCVAKRVKNYTIPLYSRDKTFISKDDFYAMVAGVNRITSTKSITTQELLDTANKLFKGVEFGVSEKNIFQYIRKNKLEYFSRGYIGNFFLNGSRYPKATVDKVMAHLENFVREQKVKLINISFKEYANLTDDEFNLYYMELNVEQFNNISEYKTDNSNFKKFLKTYQSTNVKVIWISKGKIFVSKKEFIDFCDFRENYVSNEYFKKFNLSIKSLVAKNNGIILRKHKRKYYMKKCDIDKYLRIINYNDKFINAQSMYDRFMIKIEYFQNNNEVKFPKFRQIFVAFVKYTNEKSRSFAYVSRMFNIYNAILNNINIDLEPINSEENNRLFKKVIIIVNKSNNDRGMLIKFINYLINVQGFELDKVVDNSTRENKESYTKEQFLNLLVHLIDIVANKDKLKKLYRNWNLSSCVSYLLMHYCVAWRKMDLVDQLPIPNLKIIDNVTNGESFIKWLEDGNELSEDMAYKICKSLEDKTNRLKLKAKKNNSYLNCVISSALVNEVALVLCINAANKEIHCSKNKHYRFKHRSFNETYICGKNMNTLLKDNFEIDINSILQGRFDNVKMNKGFLNLVKEKSEELGLAYSYYYAQVARGHLARKDILSETTKIYLKKDISKASVMAFATGTMGSVAYTLLELVDKEFKHKSHENKIKDIQNLNMTPYSIERNIKTIANKISVIRNELNNFFIEGGYKEGLLQDILYGQNFYGIEEKTKCLLKITRKNNIGITRIKSANYDESNVTNKSCPYNRVTCIGCEYMISLRYFIYELEKKFDNVLNDLKFAKTDIDREIAIDSINELYLPVLKDLALVLGDNINKVINVSRYLELAERS